MPSFEKMLSIAERRGYLRWMPTEFFLRYKYRRVTGKKLNLSHPTTFNEKLQKLKIIYASSPMLPEYTRMADKIRVKEIVAEKIGQEYVIPTLGVWERFNDIPLDDLPEQFVLKVNHDSGGVVVCPDKSMLDIRNAKIKLEKSLKRNFYWYGREPQYKNIQPKLFAEQYLVDKSGYELRDYKLFCFNGRPEMTLVCTGRFSKQGLHEDFYDMQWNLLPVQRPDHPSSGRAEKRPQNYELMQKLAQILSKDIPFARIDFYETGRKVYFGEITFFPASGMAGFAPAQWDRKLGDLICIPE